MKNNMKKVFLTALIFAGICSFTVNIQQPKPVIPYPAATKYAKVLYAIAVNTKEGNISNMGGHSVIKGTGQFNWNPEIDTEGEYEVILNYSVRKEGVNVSITSEKNTISDAIGITKGVFDGGKEWYNFNCDRKLLAGKLLLKKGVNSIALKVNAPEQSFETVINTLELVPVKDKASALKDIGKAIASRPKMNWFSSLKYGVMFHWTSLTAPPSGPLKPYEQAVNDFNVPDFVNMVERTGADHVIFTGCWAETYIPAPLEKWEKEYPGHTTKRDLISEISDALKKKNIKFILYLSTHVYAKYGKVDTKEFERLNYELISEIGARYKEKINGYWFDGWYQSYQKHPGFDFEKFYKVCKIGNPNRLVALNSWLYPSVSEWQDYWAGEVFDPGTTPENKIIRSGPGKGLQFQSLICLQGDWTHTPLNTKVHPNRLSAAEMANYISACEGKGPVTINIEIYQDGTIGEESLGTMEKLKQLLKKK